jgi:hypothetical protein
MPMYHPFLLICSISASGQKAYSSQEAGLTERETCHQGLFLGLLLKNIRQRYGLSYEELPVVVKRERLLDVIMQHYGTLHYYGNEGVMDILAQKL